MQVPATRSTARRAKDLQCAAELQADEWHRGRVSARGAVWRAAVTDGSAIATSCASSSVTPACPSCCPRCLVALTAAAAVSLLPLPPCSTGPRLVSRSPTTSVLVRFDYLWDRPSGHRLQPPPVEQGVRLPLFCTHHTCTCLFACPARSHCHMPLVYGNRLPPIPPPQSPPREGPWRRSGHYI